jgi:two-component system response regulator
MNWQQGEILLVEDDPEEIELTLRALQQNDVRNAICVARDGVEAIEHLFPPASTNGDRPPVPALVLLDLKLPRVDGLRVLTRIRSDDRTRLVPVVILTCSHEDSDVLASYSRGANSYIRKPVEYAAFRATVRELSRYWLLTNQAPPYVHPPWSGPDRPEHDGASQR